MSFDLLNPWMLAGLAGIGLPILAHLLSRKRYDVVEWGAMQFLELDPSARRKLRLEDFLLLVVRMFLIVLLALALSRPWVSGAWLGRFGSHQSRDVVVVLDGSYSMSWRGPDGTPEQAARRIVQSVIDGLYPGDTISLLDARDQTRLVVGPTRDFRRALQTLETLPAAAGSAHLAGAVLQATQLLSRTTNLQRDVIVLTDRQAKSWQTEDSTAWKRLDELRTLATVPVRIWACDVSGDEFGQGGNVTVERVALSREVTVPDAPVRLKMKLRHSGGQAERIAKVYLSVDGERLNDQTLQVRLPAQGEASIEFEPRLTKPGSHLMSISADEDALPADDRADAVVVVRDGLPVLLVNGTPVNDPVKQETFFAETALSGGDGETGWIRTTVQTVAETDFEKLSSYAVIVLANVADLEESQAKSLEAIISSGGRAVLLACGDQSQLEKYNKWFGGGRGWLPCRMESIAEDTVAELGGVRVSNESLELPWLKPFRSDQGGTLTEARFAKWWKVRWEPADEGNPTPGIAAKLTTGDPWLLIRQHGRGRVAVLTSSLDADWNTLPAKADYVPWMHELLFFLADAAATRNVDPGQPLILSLSDDVTAQQLVVRTPRNEMLPVERAGDAVQRLARFRETDTAGVYCFERKDDAKHPPEYFAVETDRGESDLTPLSDGQRLELTAGNRLAFVSNISELQSRMVADASRAELWWLMLYLFVAVLAWETWLTRRYVQGGAVRERQ